LRYADRPIVMIWSAFSYRPNVERVYLIVGVN